MPRKRAPIDPVHSLLLQIARESELSAPRITNLIESITELMQLAGATHLQALIAQAAALRGTCKVQPMPGLVLKVMGMVVSEGWESEGGKEDA